MAEPAVTPMRIDGQEVTTSDVLEVCSPFDGHTVGRVPAAGTAEVDSAMAAAARCHAGGAPPAHERARVLERAADALEGRTAEFAARISAEAAKPISAARTEAQRAVDTLRAAAVAARTLTGEQVPLGASPAGAAHLGFTTRVPVGVVAAVAPFNFPLNLVAHKVAPAIAAGCPVVCKPAPQTPLSALALAEVLEADGGLEPGWVNVVTCTDDIAETLVAHPAVAMVSFTGSTRVGWHLRALLPRIPVGLELGNNTPVIVEPGVDLASVAARVAAGAFGFSGQSCVSIQRVYAAEAIAAEFTDALVAATRELVAGDPADEATTVSALITPEDTERVRDLVGDAVAAGATCATGGEVLDLGAHGVLEPTVLTTDDDDLAVCRTEVFGPVVTVASHATLDEAITRANDTTFGLQAGIFTPDLDAALAAATRLDFGGVTINEVPTWRADPMPYGGVRDSGNTREGPAWAVREMTTERLVVMALPASLRPSHGPPHGRSPQ